MISGFTRSYAGAKVSVLLACYLLLATTACRATGAEALPQAAVEPVGSCTLSIASESSDEEAIAAVLAAESDFVVQQNIQALMALWHEGSYVADAKNTPDDPNDDQRWVDKDAIRHRYVRTVFPGAPTTAQPRDLEITVTDAQATVTATTQIGDEVSPGGDRWILSKVNSCWGIDSLTYNLEP